MVNCRRVPAWRGSRGMWKTERFQGVLGFWDGQTVIKSRASAENKNRSISGLKRKRVTHNEERGHDPCMWMTREQIQTIREDEIKPGGPPVTVVCSWGVRIGLDEEREGGEGQTSGYMGTDQEREERETGRDGFPRLQRPHAFWKSGGSNGGSNSRAPGGRGSRGGEKRE